MDAVAFLAKFYNCEKKVKNKIYERDFWHGISVSVSAYPDGERVQSSGNPQKMSDAVDTCVDMQREINTAVAELAAEMKDVLSVIQQLPTDEYDVLHKRYIQHMTNNDVAACFGKGASWASTIHVKGCKSVQRILDGRGK